MKQLKGNSERQGRNDGHPGARRLGKRPGGVRASGDGGRMLWEEGEGEVERERRRAEEQAARNTRIVYSLRQQVEGVEREIQHLRGAAAGKHTKKVHAHTLAHTCTHTVTSSYP